MKKPYEKPAIVHTEKLEIRAITCLKTADTVESCSGAIVA